MSAYVKFVSGDYRAVHTDHSAEVADMREAVSAGLIGQKDGSTRLLSEEDVHVLRTAAALLEVHDDTGISLDRWYGPRELVEHALALVGHPDTFLPNHV